MGTSAEHPYPPFELANRTHELPSGEGAIAAYEERGAMTRAELLRLLPEGTDLEGKRILDFGCGAGRTLRHFLAEAERGEVWGVDIDERSIDWMRRELCPPLNVATCGAAPPLDFDSGSFAFAWAISIFTHLAEHSAEWLLELHRVLEPGGLLMATFMGEWNSEQLAGEPWDPDRIGMNVLRHDQPWDQGGPMVLMSEWWVFEHWGRAFEFVGYSPWFHNQSWLMMRKLDVELSAEELLAPAEDPREIAALRHNVTQLQREVSEMRAAAARAEAERDELRRGFESTLSWRLTGPLRRLRG